MRAHAFCNGWDPREIPPPILDQLAHNGWNNIWVPERCHFTLDGEGDYEWDRFPGFPYGTTGAQLASRIRCTIHPGRPRIYARHWNANRLWHNILNTRYQQNRIAVADIDGWANRFEQIVNGNQWHPTHTVYWTQIRPPARTTHTYWIQ